MSKSDAWNSGIGTAGGHAGERGAARRSLGDEHNGDTMVSELAQAFLDEKRRSRRWGIFFKFLLALFAIPFVLMAIGPRLVDLVDVGGGQHTALIDINGVIAADETANADAIIDSLESALKHRKTAGVILRINSPGGSPVQSGIVFDEILRLRNEYPSIPIYAVLGDVCASGGYYIAAATDRIYADKASIVGSIGVRMDSFGFEGSMEKLGVERRSLTAGQDKVLMDPFSPMDPAHVEHVQGMLETIHKQFIAAVKRGRGERIKDDPSLFSGLIWSGEQALEKGLVDKLADQRYVAREVIGAAQILDFTRRQDILDRLGSRVGALLSGSLAAWLSVPNVPASLQ